MVQNKKRIISLILMLTLLVSSLVIGAITASATNTEIVFNLGADGSAVHADGSSKTTYSETVNGYTLSITGGTNMYPGARDAKGNGCIKLGTSSKAGSFTISNIPADVTSVVIEVAAYKAKTATMNINGTTTTLTTKSDNGQYDTITVDTTSTKSISVKVSSGYRAMVNSITFIVPNSSGSVDPAPEHTCQSKCPTCEKCTNDSCEEDVCAGKCECESTDSDAPEASECQWTLVTDVSTLKVGDKIVIVASGSNHALGTKQNSNNRAAVNVTKDSSETVTINDSVQILTLEAGNKDNTFAFNTGSGYLYAASSSDNYLRTETNLSANSSWTITISSEGVATIKSTGTYTRNWIRYNPSNVIFACYASAQNDICLYKFVQTGSGESACKHANKIAIGTPVDATCTATGITAGEKCSDCGEILTAQEKIPVKDHNYNEDGECSACGAVRPLNATITFDDGKTQRTKYTTEVQEWKNGDFVFTNNKGTGNNVADYSNPVRLYKGSEIIISFPGMTSLVIDATGVDNDNLWDDTLDAAGLSFTVKNKVYTITFDEPVNSITFTCANQVRAISITADACQHVDSENNYICDNEGCKKILVPADGSTLTIEQAIKLGEAFKNSSGAAYTDNKYYVTGTIVTDPSDKYGNCEIKSGDSTIYIDGLYTLIDNKEVLYESFGVKPVKYDVITVFTIVGYDSTDDKRVELKRAYMTEYVKHDHVYDNACDATCNVCYAERTVGEHVYSNACDADCNECGAEREITHNWNNGEVTTPATCTTEGVKTFTCQVAGCGETKTEVIGALDHKWSETYSSDMSGHWFACTRENCDAKNGETKHTEAELPYQAPTCTETGLKTGTKCSVCESVLWKQEVIPATGHDYDYACDKNCKLCGVETRPTADHAYNYACDTDCKYCTETTRENATHDYENNCDADCNYCGATRTPADHEYDNACDTTCNVCGAERTVGDHVYDNACDTTCNVCGAERTVGDHVYDNACDTTCNVCGAIRTITHTPAEAVRENEKASSCTAEGSYENVVYCSVCDVELSRETKTIAMKDHTAGAEATCTTAQTCTVCGAELVAAKGHSYSESVTPPTFDAQGYTTHTCANCGNSYVNAYVPALVAVAEINGVKYESLQAAVDAANGETVKLLKDVELAGEHLYISGKTLTLNLNGKTITADWETNGVCEVLLVDNGANVTITGDGKMISGNRATTNSVVSVLNGSTLTIENGTFISNNIGDVIFAKYNSTINIEGGYYEAKNSLDGMYFVLDIDENYDGAATDTSKIIVTGGSFVKFNPANHSNDGKDYTNKVAEGYHSINNNGVYTVGAHSYSAVVTAPTCTEQGYTTYTCACGDSYVDNYTDANGHSVGCGHYAADGDTLQGAIDKAYESETDKVVTLTQDVIVDGAITLPKGVVLDLNGNDLTAGGVTYFGGCIVDNGETKGRLNTANLAVANGNYEMVPVMVEENSYVFSTVKNQVAEDTTTGATVFRPSLSNSGFTNEDLFAKGVNKNLKLGLLISRIPVGGTEKQRQFSEVFAIKTEIVKYVYTPNPDAKEGTIPAFTITLTGMSEAYEYRVDIVLCHESFVVYSAPIATLPKKTENN